MKLTDLYEMAGETFLQLRHIFQSNFERRHLKLSLPTHSFERSVEGERGDSITKEQLSGALQTFLKKYDSKNPEMMAVFEEARERQQDVQVVFKHTSEGTTLNFPSVIKSLGPNSYRVTIKTIMVKNDFKPHKDDVVVNL